MKLDPRETVQVCTMKIISESVRVVQYCNLVTRYSAIPICREVSKTMPGHSSSRLSAHLDKIIRIDVFVITLQWWYTYAA